MTEHRAMSDKQAFAQLAIYWGLMMFALGIGVGLVCAG